MDTQRLPVERFAAADKPAKWIGKRIRNLTKPTKVKEALSGTWLGHPVHPLLTDVSIGTWTSAVLLDWLGGDDAEPGADRLVLAGLAASAPTIAAGWNDWADAEPASDAVRRVGLVHAAFNATGVALMASSLAARAAGDRGRGRLLALVGIGAVTGGGWLGGHLTYAKAVGVDQTVFERYPEDWTPALADAALGEAESRKVELNGVDILLARWHGEVYALANTCVHRGGPLDEGELNDGCVTCPWHQSTFRLSDGQLERGPGPYPQPSLETRIKDGSIEVRVPP
ncbi:MAG TPA: Rieske 2Fe-2S domain-containing protein [Thermoleophilaceae bacterium]|nr:Rieske 2Fe-2S domain-containing protein [Thermoleophilaceae bacterium]